ncbi:MAG: ECF transporter S component [Oscillospiraceae bacterium]
MKAHSSTRKLVQFSLLLAIEIILGVTPLGFIMVPPVSITLMHIPVIIGSIVMGPMYGMLLGGSFGIISLLKAIFSAVSPIDLLFNPIVSGNPVASVVMSVLPRIILGLLPALLFNLLNKKLKHRTITIGISAIASTVVHTLLVLLFLFLFFSAIPLITVLTTILTLNVGLEILVAAVIAIPVCRALLRINSSPA